MKTDRDGTSIKDSGSGLTEGSGAGALLLLVLFLFLEFLGMARELECELRKMGYV